MNWSYDLSLVSSAGSMRVLDGEVSFDEGWSPYGKARLTVPRTDWSAASPGSALSRHPMTVRVDMTDHEGARAEVVEWKFLLRGIEYVGDSLTGTVVVELASTELALQEKYNTGAAWMPSGDVADVASLLAQLVTQAGITASVASIAPATQPIPLAEITPWEPGQTAWEWWDRLRLIAEAGVRATPSVANDLTVFGWDGPRLNTEQLAGVDMLDWRHVWMPDEYADSVAVTWRWEDAAGEQREQRDYARPNPAYSSRRHVEETKDGPPIPGYAQRVADARGRYLQRHDVTVPMTYDLIRDPLHLFTWAAIRYQFAEEPTVTATLFEDL